MPEGFEFSQAEWHCPVHECPELCVVILHGCPCQAIPQLGADRIGRLVEASTRVLQSMCLIHYHHMPVHLLEILDVGPAACMSLVSKLCAASYVDVVLGHRKNQQKLLEDLSQDAAATVIACQPIFSKSLVPSMQRALSTSADSRL